MKPQWLHTDPCQAIKAIVHKVDSSSHKAAYMDLAFLIVILVILVVCTNKTYTYFETPMVQG